MMNCITILLPVTTGGSGPVGWLARPVEDLGSNLTTDGCVNHDGHRDTALGRGCILLLQCLGRLSLASLTGR